MRRQTGKVALRDDKASIIWDTEFEDGGFMSTSVTGGTRRLPEAGWVVVTDFADGSHDRPLIYEIEVKDLNDSSELLAAATKACADERDVSEDEVDLRLEWVTLEEPMLKHDFRYP